MPAGVSSTGLTIKILDEILGEITEDMLSIVDAELDLSSDQPAGQMDAIQAKKLAELWELSQTAYNAFNPGAAAGSLLDNLCLLSGTTRRLATKGRVTLTCDLALGTTLVAGTAIANVAGDPANQWTPAANYTAVATGSFPVVFESTQYGPIVANPGTITSITTAVSGWTAVVNGLAADPGTARETDAALRLRRQQELSAPGASTVDALQADLARVDGVIQATVFENDTDVTDLDGLPPHSFEAVIWDGASPAAANVDIAQVIWKSKPAGIATYGSITQNATDSVGNPRPVKFSRATQKNLEQAISIQVLPGWLGAQQVTALQQALIAFGQALPMGRDVILQQLRAVVMAQPFVWDITSYTIGNNGGTLFAANKVIAAREKPVFNGPITITVTQLPGAP